MIRLGEIEVGQELPAQTLPIERASMVRYAGASGDFNPIHWSEEFATSVGLPNVIAHGMLTMAVAGRLVTDWIGDPGAVLDFGVRFTRPVIVEYGHQTQIELTGKVRSVDIESSSATIDITAKVADQTVLAQARMTVRLHP